MAKSTPTVAQQTPKRVDGEKYESLEVLIEPFIHLSLNTLPVAVRKRVDEAYFLSMFWDSRPDQRLSLANQHDVQNDPANRPEMEYVLALFNEIEETKTAITNLELMNAHTPSDSRIKRDDLTALGARLDKLKKLQTLPPFLVKDWKALTDDALAEVVAANTVQAAHSQAAPVVTESASGGVKPDKTGPLPLMAQGTNRRTWRDVCFPYLVKTFKAGQYATAKAFYRALESKAGAVDSPFDKGTGQNAGSLFVRDISKPLALKTVENAWSEIRTSP